jgi:hypothetical protein
MEGDDCKGFLPKPGPVWEARRAKSGDKIEEIVECEGPQREASSRLYL